MPSWFGQGRLYLFIDAASVLDYAWCRWQMNQREHVASVQVQFTRIDRSTNESPKMHLQIFNGIRLAGTRVNVEMSGDTFSQFVEPVVLNRAFHICA